MGVFLKEAKKTYRLRLMQPEGQFMQHLAEKKRRDMVFVRDCNKMKQKKNSKTKKQ